MQNNPQCKGCHLPLNSYIFVPEYIPCTDSVRRFRQILLHLTLCTTSQKLNLLAYTVWGALGGIPLDQNINIQGP